MKRLQLFCVIFLVCSIRLGGTAPFRKDSITVFSSNLAYDTCYLTEYDISGTKIQELTYIEGSCASSHSTLDTSGNLLVAAAISTTNTDSGVFVFNPNGDFVDGTLVSLSSVNIITPMVSGTDVWMQDAENIAYTTRLSTGPPVTQTIAPTTWEGSSVQFSTAQLANETLFVVNKPTDELLIIDPVVKTGTGTTTKIWGTVSRFYVHNGSDLYVHVSNIALKKYLYQNGAATLLYSVSVTFTADSMTAIEVEGTTYVLLSYKSDTTYTVVRYTDTGSTFDGETNIIQTTQLDIRSVIPSPKATCSDGFKDQDETDVDCGGSICAAKCDILYACVSDSDCMSGFCNYGCDANGFCNSFGTCSNPTCDDNAKNQDETDVDCGGSKCGKCAAEKNCNSASDCLSGICNADTGSCTAPSCDDNVMNGAETDVDCGGGFYNCTGCAIDKKCSFNSDCAGNKCLSNLCAASCQDNILNQDETDIDCGGSTCSKCAVGKKCVMDSDCDSNNCASNTCANPIPVAPNSSPIKDKPVSVSSILEVSFCGWITLITMIM